MALSPADFYAYSNATGTPYPENAEDRAYLAPEVLEFRRNQLKSPQQESNILQTIGAAVLGLGALGAAGVAGRRLLRPVGKSATAGVRQVDLAELAKNRGNLERVSSSKIVTEPAVKPATVDLVEKSKILETITQKYPEQGEEIPFVPYHATRDVDPSETPVFMGFTAGGQPKLLQNPPLPAVLKQARQGVFPEASSLTGLQDLLEPAQSVQVSNALETGANQSIGRVEHLDQLNQKYDVTQDALVNKTIETRTITSQELADIAKEQMITRRQNLVDRGFTPGTARFEHELSQGPLPLVVTKAVEAAGANPLDPLGELKERSLVNIGPEAQVETTAAGTAIRGATPVLHEALPKTSLRQLLGGEMGPDIPGSQRVRGALSADIPAEQLSKQEITYGFLNQAPEPEIVGGSAGIGVYGLESGFVPGAMSKATGEFSAASERKPTYVPAWLAKREQTPFANLSPTGLENALAKAGKSGTAAIQNEMQRRQINRESVAASEALRRARIEGRDPQMILKQLGVVN
jgi:hypothetical protein